MGVNKVVYGNKTLIDLTESTVTPETLIEGTIAINSAGEKIEGTAKPNNLFIKTSSGFLDIGSVQIVTGQ